MRHIIPISGKDSLATALFQSTFAPENQYEFFYNDNGCELPETYAWLESVEEKTGWSIHRIGSNLMEIIDGYDFLPSHKKRYCTRMSKIHPMEKWIGQDDATVYYGIRADENRDGYVATKRNITAQTPLKTHGIGLDGVWSIVSAQNLLPPAFEWQALRDAVGNIIDISDLSFLKPWEAHILFSGRTRPNCYFCFYQRQYEYMWLHDTHPDLFEAAARKEEDRGGDGYTWREGYTLRELVSRRDEIIEKRAKQAADIIFRRQQGNLFTDFGETEIVAVSCGVLCGK